MHYLYKSIVVSLVSIISIIAQNTIQGNIESVPSKQPTFSRITFMNSADTLQRYEAMTDPLTGNFIMSNVPNGNYKTRVETQNHFLYESTATVNGNKQFDVQMIEDIGKTSPYHSSILDVLKTLTGTLDFMPDPEIERWSDTNIPILFFANNDSIPSGYRPFLDAAINDIVSKSNGKIQFVESPTNVAVGITFRYGNVINGPCPGASGCITYDSFFPDQSLKHVTIYLAGGLNQPVLPGVFRRELMRAVPTFAHSTDPNYIMAVNPSATVIHPDEGKVVQFICTLKHNTNMRPYKNMVVDYLYTGNWNCLYATIDAPSNATGYQTASVGVIKENTFAALVSDYPPSTYAPNSDFCYLVGYTNADSVNGRMGYYDYASHIIMQWINGTDIVNMNYAFDIAASKDSFIYVANNDVNRNILVFKMTSDSIISSTYRLATGADSLWAIDIDTSGYVYVTSIGVPPNKSKILIYKGIAQDIGSWGTTHTAAPLFTIELPDTGRARGVAVNSSGTVLYVSNYNTDKIYSYTGNTTSGFTLNNNFNFTLLDTMTSTGGIFLNPGPWGLGFMDTKNILFAACANNFLTGQGYQYGRIYSLDPNSGDILDTLDCAAWNFAKTGSWSSRPLGTLGTVSGYTSPFNVDFDENFNLYTQSYYGWTVDKWQYSDMLPTLSSGTLDLSALIEGFYNGTTMISDTANVELRTSSTPFNLLAKKEIILDGDGNTSENLNSVFDGVPYYLVLKHRNSIETWSANPISFTFGNSAYDFTDDSSKAFGNNMIKKGTKWCMYSGDVNQDGIVHAADLVLINNNAFGYSYGYLSSDLTGDNFVDLNDLVICDNNVYGLRQKITPMTNILKVENQGHQLLGNE